MHSRMLSLRVSEKVTCVRVHFGSSIFIILVCRDLFAFVKWMAREVGVCMCVGGLEEGEADLSRGSSSFHPPWIVYSSILPVSLSLYIHISPQLPPPIFYSSPTK
jgi:hypothetical protein